MGAFFFSFFFIFGGVLCIVLYTMFADPFFFSSEIMIPRITVVLFS